MKKVWRGYVIMGVLLSTGFEEKHPNRFWQMESSSSAMASVPKEVRELIEELDAATNAGDWDKAASCCCVPYFAAGNIISDRAKLGRLFEQLNDGIQTRTLNAALVSPNMLKPILPRAVRDFLADSDLLVRVELEVKQGAIVETDSGLYILRRVENKLTLTGTLSYPDHAAKKR